MKKTLAALLVLAILISTMITNVSVTNAADPGGGVSGTTYYVDSTAGDDGNSGTSEANAWKTLEKVNSTTFQSGDKILFKAGEVWNGQLWPKGSGTTEAAITIDKYGDSIKLPCINGLGAKREQYSTGAVMLRNQSFWEINNLEVTNDDDFGTDLTDLVKDANGKATNIRDGILIINDADLDTEKQGLKMQHIYIRNCYVHDVDSPNSWPGFADGGIIMHVVGTVDWSASKVPVYTFDNIRIENNRIEKCDLLAIMNYNETTKTSFQDEVSQFGLWHTNLYIGHNYMKNIGQGGIDLCDAKDALVEYNVLDGWSQRYRRECAGIYPWKSMNVIFQNNEVYDGPSDNDPHGDGTAFDFDSPNINITYQYNYTHNNPMGWMSYLGRSDNNIARYNISDNDGARIIRFGYFDNDLSPAYFLNNVFLFDGSKTQFSDYTDRFREVDYYFKNNVFYDKNTATNSSFWKSSPDSYGTCKFSNNCFYTASGKHEAGEPNDAKKITADPGFVNINQDPARDTNGNISGATIWDGFKLQADSPLIDKGTYLSQMGTSDFYGTELQYGAAPDIGVQEVVQGEKVTPEAPVVSQNFAKGSAVTVQYSNGGLGLGANMADGVKSTYWTSSTIDNQYVEIDFGKDQTFNEIIASEYLTTPPDKGNYKPIRPAVRDYHYEMWDGSAWKEFYNSYGIGDSKIDVFAPVTTSKIKIVFENLMNTPRISEIQVFSDTEATPGEPVTAPQTPDTVPYNVIAHYSFDNVTGSIVPDDSSNKLDATKSASAVVDSDGKFGSALYFGANGTKSDSYVSVSNKDLLNRSNFTISMWVKPDTYDNSKDAGVLYSKGLNGSECYSSAIVTTTQWGESAGAFQDPMHIATATNTKGARWFPTSTPNSSELVKAGEWSQIVHTYNQHNYCVYVNGKLYMSVPVSDGTEVKNLYMNTDDLLLGNQSKSGKDPYYGYMDEVLILDQAITPNQVKALYNGESDDTTAPAEVTGANVTAGDGQLTLTWTDPADIDFDHVTITGDGITAKDVAKGKQTATITGLANGTEYTVTVKTLDASGNVSKGVEISGTPKTPEVPDTTAPAEVGGANVTVGDGQLTLTWTDPADFDFDHVTITGDGITAQDVAKGKQTATITGLANGNEYTVTVKTLDASGNASKGVEISGTPKTPEVPDITAPAEVTGAKVTAGDGQLALTWTDPADIDFDHVTITGAAIIAQNIAKGKQTATITGLTNGTEYTVVVQTVDAAGNISTGIIVNGTPKVQESSGRYIAPAPTPAIPATPAVQPKLNVADGKIAVLELPKLNTATGEAKTAAINKDDFVKALDTAIVDNGVKKVKIEIPKVQGAKAYVIELPGTVLNTSAKAAIELKTQIGTTIVPSNMLSGTDTSAANNVELVIAESEYTKQDALLQTQIGNKPVVDLSIRVNGKVIKWSDLDAPVTVKIPYTATKEELAEFDYLTVLYLSDDGKAIPIANAKYNEAEKVVEFKTTHFSKYAIAFVKKSFTDISANSKESIEVLAAKGIIEGTIGTLFSPDKSITRGDFLMWLIKTLDLTVKFDSNFTDINSTDAYYDTVGIAKQLGITSGTGNNKFSPEKIISRQDMMVLTQKSLTIANKNLTSGNLNDLEKFSDVSKVSQYALDCIATMVKSGYISGSGNKLNPEANTTRGEAAQMLYMIYKK